MKPKRYPVLLKRFRIMSKDKAIHSVDTLRDAQVWMRTNKNKFPDAKLIDTERYMMVENAPPDPKLEKWITANKEKFKEKYGDKGNEVLEAIRKTRNERRTDL